ncbi:MAG: SigB/SigF/SigG family RNA polymerase sigma factor [Clostridiales bacterium]|jgi:RNA polymerase sporulation-specific sigma factor|nr:SigB/SigF/SigG family RNA polymerase sigma factor [Clostridiales bacterium]
MTGAAPLNHDTAIKLIRIAQQGDEGALDVLVRHNAALVKSIVKRYLGRGVEFEDLYQIGCVGLIKAIKHYDEKFNARFSTYAVPMIAGEIKRFLRDDGMVKVSRPLKELACKAAAASERLRKQWGEDPGLDDIARETGAEPAEIAVAFDAARPHVSIYERAYGDESETTVLDSLAGRGIDDSMVVDKILLKELLGALSAKERQLITLRFFQDKTQAEIAALMGVSQVQISRLEQKIIKKLRAEARRT